MRMENGTEMSAWAWMDPQDGTVIEFDPGRHKLTAILVGEASDLGTVGAPTGVILEKLAAKYGERMGLAKSKSAMEAYNTRAAAAPVRDLGDVIVDPHICRDAALASHAALAELGISSKVVWGRTPVEVVVEVDGKLVRRTKMQAHAWVETSDGWTLDVTQGKAYPPGMKPPLQADYGVKEPAQLVRPADGPDEFDIRSDAPEARTDTVPAPANAHAQGSDGSDMTSAVGGGQPASHASEAKRLVDSLSPQQLALSIKQIDENLTSKGEARARCRAGGAVPRRGRVAAARTRRAAEGHR